MCNCYNRHPLQVSNSQGLEKLLKTIFLSFTLIPIIVHLPSEFLAAKGPPESPYNYQGYTCSSYEQIKISLTWQTPLYSLSTDPAQT